MFKHILNKNAYSHPSGLGPARNKLTVFLKMIWHFLSFKKSTKKMYLI